MDTVETYINKSCEGAMGYMDIQPTDGQNNLFSKYIIHSELFPISQGHMTLLLAVMNGIGSGFESLFIIVVSSPKERPREERKVHLSICTSLLLVK